MLLYIPNRYYLHIPTYIPTYTYMSDTHAPTGTDGVKVSIDYIRRTLDANHCPALAGKPKLIFLEACRGG